MKILNWYLFRTIFQSILTVSAAMMAVTLFLLFASEFENVGQGEYAPWKAFLYIVMQLPFQFYEFSPILCLVGTLMGMGILASQSELTVMRAAGFSIMQMVRTAIQTMLILLIGFVFIGEYLAPMLNHFSEDFKMRATSAGQALRTAEGVWLRSGEKFIHIDAIIDKNYLQGITQYQFDKQAQLSSELYAKSAIKQGKAWVLQEGALTHFQGETLRSEQFRERVWDIAINAKFIGLGETNIREMSLPTLYRFIQMRKQNHLQTTQFEFDLWERIIKPLTLIVMTLLALPFVFGSTRSQTMGGRLVIGICVGFLFYLLNNFFGPFSLLYRFPPWLAAALPTLLFATVAYWRIKRIP